MTAGSLFEVWGDVFVHFHCIYTLVFFALNDVLLYLTMIEKCILISGCLGDTGACIAVLSNQTEARSFSMAYHLGIKDLF